MNTISRDFRSGVVDRAKILDSSAIVPGDALIALKSSGVHSNGFSLVRKVFDVNEKNLSVYSDELGKTLGEALLAPTRIYVRPVLDLISRVTVKRAFHTLPVAAFMRTSRAHCRTDCARRSTLPHSIFRRSSI